VSLTLAVLQLPPHTVPDGGFDTLAHDALVALVVTSPEIVIPALIGSCWHPHLRCV
jgi:hypothetical protein